MKYIRTKNGIEKLDADREHLAKYMNGKQANTIEELCDEFVYTDIVFKNVIYKSFDSVLALCKIRTNYIVYGAVWTDKGLIYVAKMNDKGELELL